MSVAAQGLPVQVMVCAAAGVAGRPGANARSQAAAIQVNGARFEQRRRTLIDPGDYCLCVGTTITGWMQGVVDAGGEVLELGFR